MNHRPWILLLLFSWSLIGCSDLEREIEIELPAYTSQPMVECYLQPGHTFSLLLTRSSPYFAPFPTSNSEFLENLLIDNAEVHIRFGQEEIKLTNQLTFNPFTRQLGNYFSSATVPSDRDVDFHLEVILPDGQVITAVTRLLPVVPIDSVVVEYAENDTLARVLTYFTDPPGQRNYYRRMLHRNNLDSLPVQDFSLDDRFVDSVVVFGSGYDYERGDLLINTLFHLDKAYFDFLESISNAANSNGNPFAQPSPIISNVESEESAIGIFTALNFFRIATVIPPP